MKEKFYVIDASTNVQEYIKLGNSLENLRKPCSMSEIQYLDKTVVYAEIDKESGFVCQDFIYEHGIPLVSEKVKNFFDDWGIDYLFYKKVILQKSGTGMEEIYWLSLPPRINCLNFEESEVDEFLNAADEIVINSSHTGRFEIFKLAGVTNLEIIVTERLADALKEKDFLGMHIYPLN